MAGSNDRPTVTLITGANQGIGLATATILAKEHRHHVIIGSRNADAGAKIAESLTAEGHAASSVQLDLESEDSIDGVVKFIQSTFGKLDVLINNAGILIDGKIKNQTTRELFTQTMSTNVIGTACLTEKLVPLLQKSTLPRVVFLSSIMGSITVSTDRTTAWYPIDYKAYDASKAAVAMLAVNYARILRDAGGLVNVACPGLVSTNLTGYSMGTTPEIGAQHIVELATLGKDGPTATFSNKEGSIPW